MCNITDVQRIFRHMPGQFLGLLADGAFTIAAASEDYLTATHTDASIVGRSVVDVFPDNPCLNGASSVGNVRASFERVLRTRHEDRMPIHRYDMERLHTGGDDYEERYWLTTNAPV